MGKDQCMKKLFVDKNIDLISPPAQNTFPSPVSKTLFILLTTRRERNNNEFLGVPPKA